MIMPTLPIFCLIAPTASGKTFFAHQLFEKAKQKNIDIEIISLDSALIYQDMNIGTAKPTKDELKHYPYHLVDICQPIDHYDVAHFLKDLNKAVQDIYQRKAFPIVVGGTMMYYKAISEGLNELPSQNLALRSQLEEIALNKGWDFLHDQLNQIDPITATKIQKTDRQRIQRALEIFHTTQQKPSLFFEQQNKTTPYICQTYTINIDRKDLHQRINQRFIQMLDEGLIEEVQYLQQKYPTWHEHSSMRAVGYRQTCEYLSGMINHATLIEKGSAATRQLAKRQITWLKQLPAEHLFYDIHDLYSQEKLLDKLFDAFLKWQSSINF
jgi:tRNA dimethylallyltransferase